jgi:hypothetical protein
MGKQHKNGMNLFPARRQTVCVCVTLLLPSMTTDFYARYVVVSWVGPPCVIYGEIPRLIAVAAGSVDFVFCCRCRCRRRGRLIHEQALMAVVVRPTFKGELGRPAGSRSRTRSGPGGPSLHIASAGGRLASHSLRSLAYSCPTRHPGGPSAKAPWRRRLRVGRV